MKEGLQIRKLQYLIIEANFVGDYIIKNVADTDHPLGSSFKTIWKTNAEGNIVEFVSDVEWNDKNPPDTSKVLKFRYKTEYQIHHQLINLNEEITNDLVWNLSELLFRHKCIIQQLFIERIEFIENKFPQTTESFYNSYQEVRQRLLG